MSPSRAHSQPSPKSAHGTWTTHVHPHDALADPLPFVMRDTSLPVGCSGLAGRRVVAFPVELVPMIEAHLADHVQAAPDSLVFTSREGLPLRRTKFRPHWADACEKAEIVGLHFHDLRGSGATWAATAGATVRELMSRLGHATPAVALRYQHATVERDKAIADRLGAAPESPVLRSVGIGTARSKLTIIASRLSSVTCRDVDWERRRLWRDFATRFAPTPHLPTVRRDSLRWLPKKSVSIRTGILQPFWSALSTTISMKSRWQMRVISRH